MSGPVVESRKYGSPTVRPSKAKMRSTGKPGSAGFHAASGVMCQAMTQKTPESSSSTCSSHWRFGFSRTETPCEYP